MEYSQIKAVNAEIKTIDIRGKDYAEVAQRVTAFRKLEPNGQILTEMLSNENGVCVFKAFIFDSEGNILAIGHASEKESSGAINKLSYIENCETSAVGRALAFCGIGNASAIASVEEMQKGKEPIEEKLLKEAEELGIALERAAAYCKKDVSELTNADLKECIEIKKKNLARKEAANG